MAEEAREAGTREKALGIRQAALRMSGIVDALLFFARGDPPERRPLDLARVARLAVEDARDAVEAARAAVEVVVQPGLPPALADELQIRRVLANLVRNAARSVAGRPAGERRIRVEAHPKGDGRGGVVCRVRDGGPGVAPEHRPHIFEPFFTTAPVGTGSGLGLAVAYGLVAGHGGSLRLEPGGGLGPSGAGACFAFDLPGPGLSSPQPGAAPGAV
jgi:signal transduction histidine kinase